MESIGQRSCLSSNCCQSHCWMHCWLQVQNPRGHYFSKDRHSKILYAWKNYWPKGHYFSRCWNRNYCRNLHLNPTICYSSNNRWPMDLQTKGRASGCQGPAYLCYCWYRLVRRENQQMIWSDFALLNKDDCENSSSPVKIGNVKLISRTLEYARLITL